MAVIARYPSSENALATVYSRVVAGKPRFEVYWRTDGQAKRKMFTDETDAHKLARVITAAIPSRSGRHHLVSTADWLLLQKAKKIGSDEIDRLLGAGPKAPRATVSDLRDRFLSYYADRAKRTRDDVTRRFQRIEETFGPRDVGGITTEDVERWYHALPGKIRHRNNTLAVLTTFLNQCRDWDYLPHDRKVVSERIRRARPLPSTPGILLPEDAHAILHHIRQDMLPYVTLGMFAGLRPSEISGIVGERSGLLWSDIDLEARTIRMRREIVGKTGTPRVVDVTDTLHDWLAPLHRGDDSPVTYRHADRIFTRENQEHQWKIPWPQDGLRHSYISYLLAVKRNLAEVAVLAGNSESIIRTNYNNPRTPEEGAQWFALTPAAVGRPIAPPRS